MTDKKHCPYCDKPLRSNNTRGACSNCLAKGMDKKAARGESVEAVADEAPPATGGKRRVNAALKEFRAVTKLLGVDGDKLIAEFAEGWVHGIREKARNLIDEV